MHQTKLFKHSWFIILASAIFMSACGEDSKDNNKTSDNPAGDSTVKQTCDCELSDNSCIDKCIRTACSCNQSITIEECAGKCETAGSCGIVSADMGEFDPMDPSSWSNMTVEVKVTSKDQLTCMQNSVKECDDSFKKTCENGKVKSCKSGHFDYEDCPNGCEDSACKQASTQDPPAFEKLDYVDVQDGDEKDCSTWKNHCVNENEYTFCWENKIEIDQCDEGTQCTRFDDGVGFLNCINLVFDEEEISSVKGSANGRCDTEGGIYNVCKDKGPYATSRVIYKCMKDRYSSKLFWVAIDSKSCSSCSASECVIEGYEN